jgi:Mg2+ and Co2+ transporter CorA
MIKTINTFESFTWYQVHEMTDEDRAWLTSEQNLPNELINYAIDPYESARMEFDEDAGLTLMIFDVVTPTSEIATTEPIGLMYSDDQKRFFSFTRDETAYVTDLLSGTQVSRAALPDKPIPVDIILSATGLLAAKFMSAILDINHRRTPLQREIRQVKQTQKMIDLLMDLQTDLIYLSNSIHTDRDLLKVLKYQCKNDFTPAQMERLDDVIVELEQAMDTGELSRQVTSSVSDAYNNLANSNLNWTMKLLTVSSIVLTVPNIVSGFFGQNVSLPFMHTAFGWEITLLITLVLMALTATILWRYGFFRK